jgi:hypothetical protein
MGSSYDNMATAMTTKFKTKASTQAAAQKFQQKHGPKGKGGVGKAAYRFGNFAEDDLGTTDKVKWLIDTGDRNWDVTSFNNLEKTICDNLSDDGPQVPMEFKIQPDGGQKAHAEIQPQTVGTQIVGYKIIIHCRN